VETPEATDPRRRYLVGALRTLLWIVAVPVATGTSLRDLDTHVPGDAGDGLLVLSVLDWGADRLPHLMSGYWQGPFFVTGHDPMAYSDTILGAVPLFALLRAVTGSSVVAMNLLLLICWVATSELTFRLARRISGDPATAVVGSLGFVYATILLAQAHHPQLVIGAPFLPLTIHLALRLLDDPTWLRGLLLGGALGVVTATTTYYGVFALIAVATVTLVRLAGERRLPDRRLVLGVALAGVAFAVVSGPVLLHYLHQSRDARFDRGYVSDWALVPGDLRTANPRGELYGQDSPLANRSASRSPERYAFPGIVVVLGAAAGVGAVGVALVRRRRHPEERSLPLPGLRRPVDMAALGAAAIVALALAIGRNEVLGVGWPFHDWAARVIPGFKGVRALVRFVAVAQLALAVLAAAGWSAVRHLLPWRHARTALAVVLVAVVLVESRSATPTVEVPTPDDGGGIYEAVRELPPGIVLDLPMAEPVDLDWPFTEVPRMVAGRDGDHPRVNGYSGYVPPEYGDWLAASQELPDHDALAELLDIGVGVLVLHTVPVEPGVPGVAEQVTRSGDAIMSGTEAEELVAGLPPACLEQVVRTTGGIVVDLDEEACRAAVG
jgi:hypothetical protein